MVGNKLFVFVGAPGSKGNEITKNSQHNGGGGAVVLRPCHAPEIAEIAPATVEGTRKDA